MVVVKSNLTIELPQDDPERESSCPAAWCSLSVWRPSHWCPPSARWRGRRGGGSMLPASHWTLPPRLLETSVAFWSSWGSLSSHFNIPPVTSLIVNSLTVVHYISEMWRLVWFRYLSQVCKSCKSTGSVLGERAVWDVTPCSAETRLSSQQSTQASQSLGRPGTGDEQRQSTGVPLSHSSQWGKH